MGERCPDCGARVASIFDHVDGCPAEPVPYAELFPTRRFAIGPVKYKSREAAFDAARDLSRSSATPITVEIFDAGEPIGEATFVLGLLYSSTDGPAP